MLVASKFYSQGFLLGRSPRMTHGSNNSVDVDASVCHVASCWLLVQRRK
jgi:hypothetical protein